MTTITAVLVFIFGTIIGSFLSVILYRLQKNRTAKKKLSIVFSRSLCPNCQKKLKWHHLIPIFSWIFLRGKCAYCGQKISVHYFLLELTTGLLFLAAFFKWNFLEVFPNALNPEFLNYSINWETMEMFIFFLILFTFLIAIFFYDLKHKEIPDRFSLPAIALAIVGGFLFETPELPSMAIGGIGIFVFFALQFFLSKGNWIGGGDLRLGALMGFLLGWEKGLLALMIAYIIGALISIILLMKKKATRKTMIPFGPFLVIGTVIAIFFGDTILNWYLSGFYFPLV